MADYKNQNCDRSEHALSAATHNTVLDGLSIAFQFPGLVGGGSRADDGLPYTVLMYANGPGSISSVNGTKRQDLSGVNTCMIINLI